MQTRRGRPYWKWCRSKLWSLLVEDVEGTNTSWLLSSEVSVLVVEDSWSSGIFHLLLYHKAFFSFCRNPSNSLLFLLFSWLTTIISFVMSSHILYILAISASSLRFNLNAICSSSRFISSCNSFTFLALSSAPILVRGGLVPLAVASEFNILDLDLPFLKE